MLDVCRSILRGRARAARGAALLLVAAVAVGSAATPAAADTYRYDVLGRLTRVTYTNGAVVHYAYDAAGNRTTVIADPTGTANPPGAANRPPVAVNDTGVEIERYTTVYITVLDNDSDPDGDPLTITSVTGAGASIGPGGAYLIYTAAGLGLRTLQYTVSDGRGGTATASVQITVVMGS